MKQWVLILGCSTGHGGATAKRLAEEGYGILGFHLDRADIKKQALKFKEELAEINGNRVHFWNKNAADIDIMNEYIPIIKEIVGNGTLKLLLHSIAFGTTMNLLGEKHVSRKQMDMTVHVMGMSMLYWTQRLHDAKLIGEGSRVIGFTSEGNYVSMEGYGPISVAKVAMEAILRQIGWELGKFGITANIIQAGVTPTRALTKISDRWEEWIKRAEYRNPMRRTTTPEDVANTVSLLLQPEADLINCSTIHCDGGEHRSGRIY